MKKNIDEFLDTLIQFIDDTDNEHDERQENIPSLIPLLKNLKETLINQKQQGISTNQPALSLTYSGTPITALGRARTTGQVEPLSRTLKINGVDILSSQHTPNIGVGTAKIFRYAVTAFTKQNAPNAPKERLNPRVFLDLNDYAQANGVDITSSEARRNFRRKLKGDLEKLRTAGVTFTEKVKGKPTRYAGLNYIGKYDISGDTIEIEFTLTMAEYLVSRPVLPYPRSLYRIDDRDANAFAIAEEMAIHYGIDNNVIRGTEGRLKIETLLKCASYPSYEKLQANKWSWEAHVKEPFEECLDRLFQYGFIKDWKYCHAGGTELTDEEARNISSYGEFVSLILWYELNDYKDTVTRAKAITEKRVEKMKKLTQSRQNKRKKKENTDNN